ncbi:MAG: ribonuclease HI [Christensenellales bacterium]
MQARKQVDIYTDGACSGNPGPGGWAAILTYQGTELEISGAEGYTTNNRMEMTGSIMALQKLKEPCDVRVHSDSSYLVNAFTKGWLENWQRRNWIKSDKKPVENKDLWLELLKLCEMHAVTWIKVRGHADDARNNRCDALARAAIRRGEV